MTVKADAKVNKYLACVNLQGVEAFGVATDANSMYVKIALRKATYYLTPDIDLD